ncbi:MAG: T9SS type A sorting domain-containing protein [Thermonemataceae bacterium]|nr:T9SS type A sorting domain-containing protein [Thermonemataceae bacterium]
MKKLLYFSFLFSFYSFGQDFKFSQDTVHQLFSQENPLPNAWAGGLNSPQFSTIDFNLDGQLDLLVYDRINKKKYTFIADQVSKKYIYTPKYEQTLPACTDAGWLLCYDYNYDGKKDILAGYNFGVEAYLNTSDTELSFQRTYDLLLTESSNISFAYNLNIFATDIPTFYDVDNDQDLDALFLDFHNGLIELHLNRSQERYGNANYLEFERTNYCWGDFLIQELNCDEVIFNVGCPFNNQRKNNGTNRITHTGSAVLLWDINNDGLLDLLISGISCNRTYVFLNEGTNKGAVFRSYTTQYPPSHPIDLGYFTALYAEDLTFDGKKDILVASNLAENEFNLADFSKSIWFYKNVGTEALPDWEFVEPNFLQNTMLDVGQEAAPTTADFDGDGDKELFVGNAFLPSTIKTPQAQVRMYKNKGNAQKAAFELIEDDFMNLSRYNFLEIKPQWQDFNNDGSLDFGFSATDSTLEQTNFYFFANEASKLSPTKLKNELYKLALPMEKSDRAYFYDLDEDGDSDAFLIKQLGNIIYLEREGNYFTEKNANVLGINISSTNRNPSISIADFDIDGKDDLVLSNGQGTLQIYPDIRANYDKSIEAISKIELGKNEELHSSYVGAFASINTTDLNGDKRADILVGSFNGGVQIFENKSEKIPLPNQEQKDIWLKPTLVHNFLYFNMPEEGNLSIFSTAGVKVLEQNITNPKEYALNVAFLSAGLYIAHFKTKNENLKTAKFVKTNN